MAAEEVFWIQGKPEAPLALVLCPFGGEGLDREMRNLKQDGVDALVSLLEKDEAGWLGLAEEGPSAVSAGIEFISYSIRDKHVPSDIAQFREFVASLAARLRTGRRIALHCRGTIGRAPLTAACTLIHLGWKPKAAIKAIEKARGCRIPDTEEQMRWILSYKP